MRTRQHHFAKRRTGLTLIELMIVVAVIAVITTIALPGFQTATKRSNEASAIASLKNILTAQNQYKIRFGAFGGVTELYAAGLIDQNFEDGDKSGYTFQNVSAPTSAQWEMEAIPTINAGDRFFFIDSSGVIRFNDSAQAGSSDPPVDGS